MQAKGIPEDLAARALDALTGTELERARAAWQRRFDAPPGDARERLRQQRFLAGRGFDGETIATLLREVRRTPDDDSPDLPPEP